MLDPFIKSQMFSLYMFVNNEAAVLTFPELRHLFSNIDSSSGLTRKFQFPTAGVAVMFCAKVSDGVISEVGRSKDHVVGPAGVTQEPLQATLL